MAAVSVAIAFGLFLKQSEVDNIAKERDGYQLLVREMRQADDYDTCADYPQWQEGAYVVEGTVFCINGQEVRMTAAGFSSETPGLYK